MHGSATSAGHAASSSQSWAHGDPVLCLHAAGQLRSGPGSRLDLAAFVTTQRGTLVWARGGFGSRVPAAVAGSLCTQTTTQRGLCDADIAGLNSSERYYLWVASGRATPQMPRCNYINSLVCSQRAKPAQAILRLRHGCRCGHACQNLHYEVVNQSSAPEHTFLLDCQAAAPPPAARRRGRAAALHRARGRPLRQRRLPAPASRLDAQRPKPWRPRPERRRGVRRRPRPQHLP